MKTIFLFTTALFFTLAASAQVEQVKMDRSNPLTMEMKMIFWSGAEGYITSLPLGYVEVGIEDSFARDYSALAGSSGFSFSFDDNIINFTEVSSAQKPLSIGIMEMKSSPESDFLAVVDHGKTALCIQMGHTETPPEELSKMVRLVRTKDGRLAAMVTVAGTDEVFSQLPGVRDKICLVVPLEGTTPSSAIQLAKDAAGNVHALLIVHEGMKRVKSEVPGKANLNVTILTPSDKVLAEKMGMTLVVVN